MKDIVRFVRISLTEEYIFMRNQFTPKFEELPSAVPLFPIRDAVVLPNAQLPLNVFEPRYLEMVSDALSTNRLIGMIQPLDDERDELYQTGCLGRIVSFSETRDNRILLLLSGISRFDILREVDFGAGYRKAEISFDRFILDLIDDKIEYDRQQLILLAKRYLNHKRLNVEWSTMDELSFIELVDTLGSSLPFSSRDKQGIIETIRIQNRCELIAALCEFTADYTVDGEERTH